MCRSPVIRKQPPSVSVLSTTYTNLSSRRSSSTTSFTCCTSFCSTTSSVTPSLWYVPQAFISGIKNLGFNHLTPYTEAGVKTCLSGLSALVPRKFLPSRSSALAGYAEGNSCYIPFLNCVLISSCCWHSPGLLSPASASRQQTMK